MAAHRRCRGPSRSPREAERPGWIGAAGRGGGARVLRRGFCLSGRRWPLGSDGGGEGAKVGGGVAWDLDRTATGASDAGGLRSGWLAGWLSGQATRQAVLLVNPWDYERY